MITQEIKKKSLEIFEKAVAARRHLHMYPELGFHEIQTASFIARHLEALGVAVQTNLAETGICATIKGDKPGKVLAIRADIDALPIEEANTFPHISKNPGVMHACGHDAHTAIALGAAEILAGLKHEIHGSVKFIFQPAEEGLGGAKYMIEAGVLCNPQVDAIIATHVCPSLDTGTISVGSGPVMASPGEFEILLKGKGGHAAEPQKTIDPIILGTNLVNLFQTILTREKSAFQPAVLSVTYFHAGSSFNIIPDTAVLKGTLRTFDRAVEKQISEKMHKMTASLAEATGAGYEFKYQVGYPPVVNHGQIAALIAEASKKIIDGRGVITNPEPFMLGEDFSFYVQQVPGAMFNLGCRNPAKGAIHNLHSSRFDIDEDCLRIGMEIMSQCAIDYLKS